MCLSPCYLPTIALSYRDVENKTRFLTRNGCEQFPKNDPQELTNHELGIRAWEEGAKIASNLAHILHHPVMG